MMILLEIVLLLLTGLLAIPALVVSSECLLALLPTKARRNAPSARQGSVAVLIPAHNEEQSIGLAIDSVLPQLHAQDRIVVVADHCTDRTAERVRSAGATVIERTSDLPRGKGHALNASIDALRNEPPDFVLIIDADCVLDAGGLDALAAAAQQTARPAQARYVMQSHDGQGVITQVSSFAFLVRNVVRPLGLARIGQPCHLMGSGMAFPWQLLERSPVPTDHLVEDLQMGLDLLRQGYGPVFCDTTQVTSQFPPSKHGAEQQHKRWAHGQLRTMMQEVPRLLRQAVAQRRSDLVLAALDLAVPPLSLLVLLLVGTLAAAVVVALAGGPPRPAAFLAVITSYFFAAILGAWAVYGRDVLSAGALLRVPLYAIMKIPIYLGFVTQPQKTWQSRSERNADK